MANEVLKAGLLSLNRNLVYGDVCLLDMLVEMLLLQLPNLKARNLTVILERSYSGKDCNVVLVRPL